MWAEAVEGLVGADLGGDGREAGWAAVNGRAGPASVVGQIAGLHTFTSFAAFAAVMTTGSLKAVAPELPVHLEPVDWAHLLGPGVMPAPPD